MTSPISRRQALAGAATVGLGAPLLAACGDDTTTVGDPTSKAPSTTPPTSSAPTSSAPSGAASSPAAEGLATTADIPVGGGTIFGDQKVVITQPTAGEFKAFSAICTHNSCVVGSVADGTINCPCHNSKFNIADGSVAGGPAPSALPAVEIKVSGDQIALA